MFLVPIQHRLYDRRGSGSYLKRRLLLALWRNKISWFYIWFPIAVSLCTCRRSNEEYCICQPRLGLWLNTTTHKKILLPYLPFFFYVHNVISFINETGWLMFGFQHKHINSIVEFWYVIYKMRIGFTIITTESVRSVCEKSTFFYNFQ